MNGLQWWCSAQTAAWTWSPRPFPGVWLLVALLVGVYWLLRRFAGEPASASERSRDRKGNWAWFGGVLVLWIALDWPVGALSGYLASAHMLQYLLTVLAAPPLLLLGVPAGAWRRLASRSGAVRVVRFLTHPLIALAIFQLVLLYTHIPSVVDRLMVTPSGSFAIDTLWLTAGLVFWWPVVSPVPARPWFGYPLKMGYLFLSTVLNTMPYAFLTFGELPFYGIYELAPPVGLLGAREDQQLAGLMMKVGGGVILWTAITILFFRWYSREGEAEGPAPSF
ncbi:MAG: cytochrome c oxidase assembly protein [Gemmatimonadetes bacterium]|nr:cytochrome c oxidase assembly protein [Gemmatimonadota bacterium]